MSAAAVDEKKIDFQWSTDQFTIPTSMVRYRKSDYVGYFTIGDRLMLCVQPEHIPVFVKFIRANKTLIWCRSHLCGSSDTSDLFLIAKHAWLAKPSDINPSMLMLYNFVRVSPAYIKTTDEYIPLPPVCVYKKDYIWVRFTRHRNSFPRSFRFTICRRYRINFWWRKVYPMYCCLVNRPNTPLPVC